MEDVIARIDELKARLDRRRPLPRETVRSIRDAVRLEWTFHTNALEGNTLTLRETQVVLEGLTIGGGKSLREHLEVVNHATALSYLENLANGREPVTVFVIRQFHGLILKGIDDEQAGRIRSVPVAISGSRHTPPDPVQVPLLLDNLLNWLSGAGRNLHPVVRAARFHHPFVYMHPFTDGNGRTARLLMNLLLMREGYVPAILKSEPERRIAYLDARERASLTDDTRDFENLVAHAEEESLRRHLEWTASLES